MLDEQEKKSASLMKLKNDGLLTVKILESFIPLLVLQMFETFAKIVIEYGIIKQ